MSKIGLSSKSVNFSTLGSLSILTLQTGRPALWRFKCESLIIQTPFFDTCIPRKAAACQKSAHRRPAFGRDPV